MTSRIRLLVGAVAGATVVAVAGVTAGGLGAGVDGAAAANIAAPQPPPEEIEGTARYLVRYAAGTDVAAEARSLRSQGVAVRRTFSYAVRGAAITATPAKAAALARSPRVEAVEIDGIVRASETQPSAPWGLDRADQRSLPLSTDYTAPSTGSGVTAYVVDSGILASHVDFDGRVVAGWTAIADGNGTSDCNGHGTHVAGTVAGKTYGIAKALQLVPVRVLDCNGGGYMSDVVGGLDWAVGHHADGVPAVMNLSLGGGANSTVDAALNAVIEERVTAVVAAGNESADACNASPARVPAAITIAATNKSDQQASFSNYGTCVDLYAPGVSIPSTWHTSTTATDTISGTSMASPHAAGAAALLISQGLATTPADVASRLINDATTGVVSGRSAGTPDRLLFVAPSPTKPAATAPAAPTGVTAVARIKAALVTWTQGADGGSPLTGQSIGVYSGGSKIRTVAVSASATRYKVLQLKPGVLYRFTVTANNAVGSSPGSTKSNAVKPRR